MAKLAVKRDRQLIMQSNIINDYPDLLDFFKNTPNMDRKDLNTLSDKMQRIFNDLYENIVNGATLEWSIDYSHPIDILEEKNKVYCQICGRKIKKVCYIVNENTQDQLKVGTECVKHFNIDRDISIEKLISERKKIKRLEVLNEKFPGIKSKLNQWKLFIDKQPIFIKYDIKNKYLNLGEKAVELFYEYCDKKTSEKRQQVIIKELKEVFIEQQKEISYIQNYVDENENKKLIPQRHIIQWLERNNNKRALELLEKYGDIRACILYRITEESFVKSLIPDFNKHLKKIYCTIECSAVSRNNIGYIIKSDKKKNISLFMPYPEFCIEYGGLITNENIDNEFSFSEILKIARIHDEESIDTAIGILQMALNRHGLMFDNIYSEFDDLIVYEKKTKKYFIIKLTSFIEKFKFFIFNLDNTTSIDIYSYIMAQTSKKLSDVDIEDLKRKRNKSA